MKSRKFFISFTGRRRRRRRRRVRWCLHSLFLYIFFLAICSAVSFLFCINEFGRSLLAAAAAAARSESLRRSSYLDTYSRREIEKTRERETPCNDATEIGFREFSRRIPLTLCVDYCCDRFFFLLLVGW